MSGGFDRFLTSQQLSDSLCNRDIACWIPNEHGGSNQKKMTESEILPHLRTIQFGKKIVAFDSLDSTNLRAKSLPPEDAVTGTVVITDEQTAGRGRLGRTWTSEKGENLTFSIILRCALPAESAGVISMYASLAVARAIQSQTGEMPECKWPNDVLLNGKKCCGILSDASIDINGMSSVI